MFDFVCIKSVILSKTLGSIHRNKVHQLLYLTPLNVAFVMETVSKNVSLDFSLNHRIGFLSFTSTNNELHFIILNIFLWVSILRGVRQILCWSRIPSSWRSTFVIQMESGVMWEILSLIDATISIDWIYVMHSCCSWIWLWFQW